MINIKKAGSIFTLLVASTVGSTMNINANPYKIDRSMSFFITSDGSGDGANYGGLEGADAHCNALAETAGSSREWAAYLSTSLILDRSSGVLEITNGINARDRIGRGPWYNAEGVLIARNIYHLHRESVNIDIETGLDENGNPIDVNEHDILTGSDSKGYFSTAGGDTTCNGWTGNGEEGSAIVGHHDRIGGNASRNFVSWNSSHGTFGCGEDDLPATGSAGLLYCFAID